MNLPHHDAPSIGIYTGEGSSHSWLWFAEVFERQGLMNLRFIDEQDIKDGVLEGLDALAVSGGDTFAIAGALGEAGAAAIESFVRGGGVYLGSCAGAYLFLRSSKTPLNLFNLTQARISNLASALPQALILPEKFSTAYGCSYVFHPVRGAMRLQARPGGEFAAAGSFPAPLYGGPAMLEAPGTQILARYQGFCNDTVYLAEPGVAKETLLGRAAVLMAPVGQGRLYLFGPHLEHPDYPQANNLLLTALGHARSSQAGGGAALTLEGKAAKKLLRDIKREVSNCRVVAWGLRGHDVRWLIGKKVYDPAKVREFLSKIWPRLLGLEKIGAVALPGQSWLELPDRWQQVTQDLRALRQGIEQDSDDSQLAARLFKGLGSASAQFMDIYFLSRRQMAGAAIPRRLAAQGA